MADKVSFSGFVRICFIENDYISFKRGGDFCMKRRNFMKIMGVTTLAWGIGGPVFSESSPAPPEKIYDSEPPIWGSPYYGDTHSTLDFCRATYKQQQREFAHFHMSEKPRDLYLFEVSSRVTKEGK